ncbi:hypothetical protein SESBI_05082 [Sesbania bispinosa]|nr:hypothetical protein SESBI_05082 [Sesbania bispinosa]
MADINSKVWSHYALIVIFQDGADLVLLPFVVDQPSILPESVLVFKFRSIRVRVLYSNIWR